MCFKKYKDFGKVNRKIRSQTICSQRKKKREKEKKEMKEREKELREKNLKYVRKVKEELNQAILKGKKSTS